MPKPSRLLVLIAFLTAICIGAPASAAAAFPPPKEVVTLLCFRGNAKDYVQAKDKHNLPKHPRGYRCVLIARTPL